MSKTKSNGSVSRRNLIQYSALTTVGLSVGLSAGWGAMRLATPLLNRRGFALNKTKSPLRVAVSSWMPSAIKEDIIKFYLSPISEETGRPLVIDVVESTSLELSQRDGDYDAFITAPNFHSWLYPEHAFFGSLPYGFGRDEKVDWLNSPKSKSLQAEYFGHLNLVPQALAVGSDEVGILSLGSLKNSNDLQGKVFAESGVISNWLSSMGAQSKSFKIEDQAAAFDKSELSLSGINNVNVTQAILSQVSSSTLSQLTFIRTPRLRTAPVLFALWNSKSFASLSNAKNLSALHVESAMLKISERWLSRENEALAKVTQTVRSEILSDDLVRAFEERANEYRQQLAGRNKFASKLAASYEAFGPQLKLV